jgi:hypothetical protein
MALLHRIQKLSLPGCRLNSQLLQLPFAFREHDAQ